MVSPLCQADEEAAVLSSWSQPAEVVVSPPHGPLGDRYTARSATQPNAVRSSAISSDEIGPLHLAGGEPIPAEGSPISRALRRLGVVKGEHFDEFDAVGLGRHRETVSWLPPMS